MYFLKEMDKKNKKVPPTKFFALEKERKRGKNSMAVFSLLSLLLSLSLFLSIFFFFKRAAKKTRKNFFSQFF